MKKIIIITIQILILFSILVWLLENSYVVSLNFEDYKISTSTSFVLITILAIILIALLLQRLLYGVKHQYLKYKINREIKNINKGYSAFTASMIALSNKDFKKLNQESSKALKYLKNQSLILLLKSETLKKQKKFTELEKIYEEMLKNESTEILGLRGLMKQFLYAQDYHHAFIYGEKLFIKNPNIDKLYETLINIVGKTNNWQKLIDINEKAFVNKIINKKLYSINKSIAFYEIAKIKKDSDANDSITLIEKALKLREYFPPYVSFYIQILLENNQVNYAKKFIIKAWNFSSHPSYKNEIKKIAEKLKISFEDLAINVTSSSKNSYHSKILLAFSYIDSQKWLDAKKILSTLLEHKPSHEVCMLMSQIEEGETNDPQKINAWISRSEFGELSKIWVCKITNISQSEWTAVSNSGYFNSLEWKKPDIFQNISSSNIESNLIEYINN